MDNISLKLLCDSTYLPVVLSFAEKASQAFGLGKKEIFAVRLSAEEIFTYLCRTIQEKDVEIICKNCGYCIEMTFLFKGEISLKVFNLTSSVFPDRTENLDEMGLLIVSRLADNFKILKNQDGTMSLVLVKDKIYPEPGNDLKKICFEKSNSFTIKEPNNEQIKIFATSVCSFCDDMGVPDFFRFPGKLVDMVQHTDYTVLVAMDEKQQVIGGIIWHWISRKLIEFSGPFVFKEDFAESPEEQLIIGFLESVGKSDAMGVYSQYCAGKLSDEYFEVIGRLPVYDHKAEKTEISVCFRQLKEDTGAVSWAGRSLQGFLENIYHKLFLPRKIATVSDMGETIPENSVLSVDFFRFRKTAILRIILPGKDMEKNIKDHVSLITRESYGNIFFELDLGIPGHAHAADALVKNRFLPALLIPCAGNGDMAVFVRRPDEH